MVVGGVAYRVITAGNSSNPATFVATSARTGATLWTLSLPGNAQYEPGMSATGQRVLVSFTSWHRPGGVLAINIATHRVAWSSNLPTSTIDWTDNSIPGRPYTDGVRVYASGSSNVINAYRLSDGARLWTVPITFDDSGRPNRVDGIAVGSGLVYTAGVQGLVAFDAASGRRLWKGATVAGGTPVLAGGRVFASTGSGVEAFRAAGCGRTTCAPLWTTSLAKQAPQYLTVAAADASTVFLTFRKSRPGGPGSCTSGFIGVVARFSASTGQLQWSTSTGSGTTGLVRGGNTIWLFNEYVNSSCVEADRILAYSTTATGPAPAAAIDLPADYSGYPQSLAIAAGTLFEQTWTRGYLIGYRVPRT